MMKKRKICVVLVDRANYGRMKPVMRAVQERPELELQTICTGTMVLERFGEAFRTVEANGFSVDSRIYIELEGSVPTTMAKSVGFAVIEFASELRRLAPDILLLIGDRYEALAAVIVAAYQNICIAHIEGGEVSGSIDESARHAMSKFAHYHFEELLEALSRIKMQTLLLWPNIDAGADHISKAIRIFRDRCDKGWIRFMSNIPPEAYQAVLSGAACAVGNSSSFVRYASYFGTPVVLVGNRQEGRETDEHVVPVEPLADRIEQSIREQLAHGRYPPSTLYGDGRVSERIAERLAALAFYTQKRLDYIYDDESLTK